MHELTHSWLNFHTYKVQALQEYFIILKPNIMLCLCIVNQYKPYHNFTVGIPQQHVSALKGHHQAHKNFGKTLNTFHNWYAKLRTQFSRL